MHSNFNAVVCWRAAHFLPVEKEIYPSSINTIIGHRPKLVAFVLQSPIRTGGFIRAKYQFKRERGKGRGKGRGREVQNVKKQLKI